MNRIWNHTFNKTIKTLTSLIILLCSIYTCFIAYNSYKIQKKMWDIKDTPGVIIITWNTDTWEETPTAPNDLREYLDYIMEYWEAWIDYFVATPTDQPSMNSSDSSINTENMHKYIHKNRISFDIQETRKTWYIMFITTKKISNNRFLFLWINWKTIWRIDLTKNLILKDNNEYLFFYGWVPIIWDNYSWNENLY